MCLWAAAVGGGGEEEEGGRRWSTCSLDLTDRPVCAVSAGHTEGGDREGRPRG